MTVCVRDEQDVIRAFVDYHLAAGVDHILVRDTGSTDQTLRILGEVAAGGQVSVVVEPRPDFDQSAWVTELAHVAWAQHGADWVLHGDADEFWWTRHPDLKAAFERVPAEVVAVPVPRTNFLMSAEEAGRWWERLTVRDLSGLNWQGRTLHPKFCHRGRAGVVVDHGAMGLSGPGTERVAPLPGLEILHVPGRTRRQFAGKVHRGATALASTAGLPDGVGSTWRALAGGDPGQLSSLLDAATMQAANLADGSRSGTLVRDLRLAHAMDGLRQAGRLGREDPAVIIPVYGQQHLTHAVVADLERDGYPCAVYVVDNGGDYEPAASEYVLRQERNLHWAGGVNAGLLFAQDQGHPCYALLNNDVRLSTGFLAGLVQAWEHTGAALVGPAYDRNWPQQRTGYTGPAADFQPVAREREVPFLDGTCLLLPHDTLRTVGLIDQTTWPRYGWGADKDYALRVRSTGGRVAVSERAYLNHLGRQTAATAAWYDEAEAEAENDSGMAAKWGPDWPDRLYHGFDDVPRAGLVQLRLAR